VGWFGGAASSAFEVHLAKRAMDRLSARLGACKANYRDLSQRVGIALAMTELLI
jgi:hypothetical protein